MHNQQKKLQEQKEIALIFKQILLTDTVRKCMEISQENLYVDIRTYRVNPPGFCKRVVTVYEL